MVYIPTFNLSSTKSKILFSIHCLQKLGIIGNYLTIIFPVIIVSIISTSFTGIKSFIVEQINEHQDNLSGQFKVLKSLHFGLVLSLG